MIRSPFSIRIYLPDGDPQGIRIIDRMNWTGVGIAFPRDRWGTAKARPELAGPGVYILIGYAGETDDRPMLYIGQAENVRDRIESHDVNKEFWNRAIVFASARNALNRGHITYLEHALLVRARQVARCKLDNATAPQEPTLSEPEKADTVAFLEEILQILPLVNVHAFDVARPVATPHQAAAPPMVASVRSDQVDTIVVPANPEGFNETFLGENQWYAIRISGGMLQRIKYIAGYQTEPISAITHVAAVDRIEPYDEGGKYRVIFSGPAEELPERIPYADAPRGTLQGPRYASLARLRSAHKLMDVFKDEPGA